MWVGNFNMRLEGWYFFIYNVDFFILRIFLVNKWWFFFEIVIIYVLGLINFLIKEFIFVFDKVVKVD